MLILSYGYKKPQTGDRGSIFFPALEDDIQRINDHNHNGTNSAPLSSSAVVGTNQDVSSAGWALFSGSIYRQLVTMPGTLLYQKKIMSFLINNGTTMPIFHPTVEQVSSNSFYIYSNDNSINVRIVYS